MKKTHRMLKNIFITAGALALAFLVCFMMDKLCRVQNLISMIFVLAVFLIAVTTDGYVYGVVASIVSVLLDNFVFTVPYFEFDFLSPENFVTALIMLVVVVITSTMTTQLKEQQRIKAEIEAEQMRSNLLRAVSHDLRTPLTTIYGSSLAIMENYDSLKKEQQLKLLGEIHEDSESLIRMVENLLSVTRVNTDIGVELQKQSTVLEELVDTAVVKFCKVYPDVQLKITIPEEFICIPADAMLIEQVLFNLLENSVHHANGMTRVELNVYVQEKKVYFTVSDDGCGVSKEKLRRLFTGRLTGTPTPSDGTRHNMGIGLSVCAAIIKGHGGEISAKNRKNGGAEFTFWLKEASDEQQ